MESHSKKWCKIEQIEEAMETKQIEVSGRKYEVIFSPDMPPGAYVIVGPPDGLVDSFWTSRNLPVPEPFATNLHNILFDRRIFTYKDISGSRIATGVLQEAIQLDAQLLAEAFFNYEKESV